MIETILNHHGFSRLPFSKNITPEEIFVSSGITETSAMIELGLASEDIILLTGPIGCGKSLAARRAVGQLDSTRYLPIYLRGNISSPAELFKMVLRGMKINPPHSITRAKPLFFSAVNEAVRKPLVILDDSQDIAQDALLSLKAMTNFDSDSRNLITFILVGQPELTAILSYSDFESLRTRIRLSHHMTGMSLEETVRYIDHGLELVKKADMLFSDNAKMEVYKRTKGIARKINSLCYKAIVWATVEKRHSIDAADIPGDEI